MPRRWMSGLATMCRRLATATVETRTDPPMTPEVTMFLLLPLIGGFLAGWLARCRVAIPVEIALFAIGAASFVLSAPSHDATYTSGIAICLPAALVSAGTTALGMWLRRRRTASA
jgi:hypothetical protein